MKRKDVIARLRELYKIRKSFGVSKTMSSYKQYEDIQKLRKMIDFYEGLINSDNMDTWISINKISKKIEKDKKRRNR